MVVAQRVPGEGLPVYTESQRQGARRRSLKSPRVGFSTSSGEQLLRRIPQVAPEERGEKTDR